MANPKRRKSERKLVVNVPGDVKRITTLDLIKMAVLKSLDSKKAKKSVVSENGIMPDMSRMNDISTLAIVVDNEVVDVMRAQPRLSSILLAEPKFVKINKEDGGVRIGDKYLDGKFVPQDDKVDINLNPQEFKLGETQ
jgi:hypothetical protein